MWYPYLARTAFIIKLYEYAGAEDPERAAYAHRYFFDPLGKETLDALNALRRPYLLNIDRPLLKPIVGKTYDDLFQVTVTDHTRVPIGGVQINFKLGDQDSVYFGQDSKTKTKEPRKNNLSNYFRGRMV
jgi:hypothetical protein